LLTDYPKGERVWEGQVRRKKKKEVERMEEWGEGEGGGVALGFGGRGWGGRRKEGDIPGFTIWLKGFVGAVTVQL